MTDTSKAATIARRAAVRLAEPIDTALPDKVEKELSKDPFSRTPDRVLDPISVASLIVSLVSFGWTVYRDLKGPRGGRGRPRRTDRARRRAVAHVRHRAWPAASGDELQTGSIDHRSNRR